MRILIDLQACQSTGSRHRGIGRYSMALAKAMARQAGEHEIHLLLNGTFEESVFDIRREFADLLPHSHFHVWRGIEKVSDLDPSNEWRRRAGEQVRETMIRHIAPDYLHVSSLFEGWVDDALTHVRGSTRIPTAVTLYDLIPLIHREHYLRDERMSAWYYRKLQALKDADLLLAISNSSRQEAIEFIHVPERHVVNISSAVDERFSLQASDPDHVKVVMSSHGLKPNFLMYTGGIDLRKNIEGLISAYAQLPLVLRDQHQLAIVCSVHDSEKKRLLELGRQQGLRKDDLVLTGYVDDADLPVLYRACKLFVFPSWHEGFGLPALEAMACGAPVIAANSSSLPEVIGRADALFDPHSKDAIAAKIQQVLTDESFSQSLRQHATIQAKKFSWDESARVAIAAMEASVRERSQHMHTTLPVVAARKPRLAFVAPMPPEKTGIADYSAELLPELSRFYDIDLISDQSQISNPWLKANFDLCDVKTFRDRAHRYDRVLYHFGNSPFHGHMFELLQAVPGAVVLHDFYLSNIVAHLDYLGTTNGGWPQALYESHGYPALIDHRDIKDPHQVIWKYPCNLAVLQGARGVIVHSQFSIDLAKHWYGPKLAKDWNLIPHLRCMPEPFERNIAKTELDLKASDFLLCSFGLMGPTKLNDRLFTAWKNSGLAEKSNCYLVFVGENDAGAYGSELLDQIKSAGLGDRVKITGFAEASLFQRYLRAADVAVQLRTKSRGETSGTVLDCMAHGVPTIINSHGTMAALPADALCKMADDFSDQELCDALRKMYESEDYRNQLAKAGVEQIQNYHQPYEIGARYYGAIEEIYQNYAETNTDSLLQQISTCSSVAAPTEVDILNLAKNIAANFSSGAQKRLLVDVTTLAQVDAKSGIQRVVREILRNLLKGAFFEGRVEPVILTEHGLKYARTFACDYFDLAPIKSGDDLLDVGPNDIFLGLDLNCGPVVQYVDVLHRMRVDGALVYFVVYDLLPVTAPHFFESNLSNIFQQWIQAVVGNSDGVICISAAVQNELSSWLANNHPSLVDTLHLDFFHLGADVSVSDTKTEFLASNSQLQSAMGKRTTFLMVGTIEPRKGHEYALDAFEQLWRDGEDVSLLIVGGRGWKTEKLIQRIESHVEYGVRLFCVSGVDDQTLMHFYRQSACLLMASWGEGFGLPLIEAARNQLPVLARQLPVFQEICGDHASYFDGNSPEALGSAIRQWIKRSAANQLPKIEDMNWLTWEQSAADLSAKLLRMSQAR